MAHLQPAAGSQGACRCQWKLSMKTVDSSLRASWAYCRASRFKAHGRHGLFCKYDHAGPCKPAPCFYLKSAQLSDVSFPTNCTPPPFLFSAPTSSHYPSTCSLFLLSSNSSSLSWPLFHGFHKYHKVKFHLSIPKLSSDANWIAGLLKAKQDVVLVVTLSLKKPFFGFQATALLDWPPTSLMIFLHLV